MIKIIVACDKHNVIGSHGQIPWNIKEEMAHFRRTTMNSVVIMGYSTYVSLGMPMLPGRDNVVITSKAQERFKTFQKLYPDAVNGPAFVDSLDEAIRYAQFVHPKKDIYVIGGSKIYALALDSGKVDEIILSLVDGEYTGDTYFPQISDDYFIESNVLHEQFSVVTYKKYSRYYSNL